jgi:hypothetical protein
VGTIVLDSLNDTVITTPQEFQTLEYNGTNWVNAHASVVTYARNAETTTLTTGTVVYLFGATGDQATVKRADNTSDTTSSKTIGIVGANIVASGSGPIITRGYVDGINLSSGYSPGQVLWLGTGGTFTTTKPTAPDHLVFVGVAVRCNANGIVYVATQNGYELDELHNVSITSPASGEFIKYNGSLWVNDAINLGTDTDGNYVAGVTGGTGITVTGSGSEGSVPTIATVQDISTSGSPSFSRVTSTVATGTSPLTVASSTLVANLNADLLDGQQGTFYTNAGNIDAGVLAVARGGTNSSATATAGGIGYGIGTAHAYTAAGTSGQVLQSAGTGAPIWATYARGFVAQDTSIIGTTNSTTTTYVDTDLSINATVVIGRRYKWTVQGHVYTTGSPDVIRVGLLNNAGVAGTAVDVLVNSGGTATAYTLTFYETATVSPLLRKVSVARATGSGTAVYHFADTSRRASLTIEDVGI